MLSTKNNRIDPSNLDRGELERLGVYIDSVPETVSLIGPDGRRTLLPLPIYRQLIRMVDALRRGCAVAMLPEDETFTSQAAADFLGMSRQFLVTLLDKREIPYHRVGAHRRIYFKDLMTYKEKRDQERSDILDELAREVDEAGMYFQKGTSGTKS